MFKKEFDASFVGFMKDGAKWLVDNTDIKLVGKIWIDFAIILEQIS
jgi:kynurenine formamidase